MFKLIRRKSTVNKPELIVSTSHLLYLKLMGQHVLDINTGKTAVLSCHRFLINSGVEKRTTFKYGLEICPPDVSK